MSDNNCDLAAVDIDKKGNLINTKVAYYRLADETHKFFLKCQEEHNIIGFEYDKNWTLGLILEEKINK